jgi:hypothetical protein
VLGFAVFAGLLASCDAGRVSGDAAGQLVYPGATPVPPSNDLRQLNEVVRTYSLATGTTAAEIVDWYTQALASQGYRPAKYRARPSVDGPRTIYTEYQGPEFRLALDLEIDERAPANHALSLTDTSPRALARPVVTITVTVRDDSPTLPIAAIR